jgi:hypothetical protein
MMNKEGRMMNSAKGKCRLMLASHYLQFIIDHLSFIVC